MKRFVFILGFVALFYGCSDETKVQIAPFHNDLDESATEVYSVYELGNCSKNRNGDSVWVMQDSAFYICFENEWNAVEAVFEDVSSSSVKSSASGRSSSSENRSSSEGGPAVKESSSSREEATLDDDDVADPAKVVYGSLEDPRDGVVYKTVKIGNQNWMAENLNFLNDTIYSGCLPESYGGCAKYGRGYMWFSAMELMQKVNCSDDSLDVVEEFINPQHRGVCPEGWHIPNNAEWKTLIDYVEAHNGKEMAGTSLKTDDWVDVDGLPKGTNRFGFSAKQGGRMDPERTSKTACGYNGIIMTYAKYPSENARKMFSPRVDDYDHVAYGATFCSADGYIWTVGMSAQFHYDEFVYPERRYFGGCYVRCVEDK